LKSKKFARGEVRVMAGPPGAERLTSTRLPELVSEAPEVKYRVPLGAWKAASAQ
jgi:hypothetical protein